MLKGVKKDEVNKLDYRFKEKGKGYYKVVDLKTGINRTMSKDKVESIFGVLKEKKVEQPIVVNIDNLINGIDIEKFKVSDLTKEDKEAIKNKCQELKLGAIQSYKDMLIEIKKNN